MAKARTAEIQIKGLTRSYGLAPGLVRRIQIAAVQSIALYGAELWWKGQKNLEDKMQLLVNRQARAITGMYPSTPIQPLLSEAGLVPARILLSHRQRMYAYRLLSLPEDHPAKEILPVSFRKGDGDTQPGDQPEDTLLWASNERTSTYGQWLARQVFLTGCIDPADGVEPIEGTWNLGEDSLMHVVIVSAEKAILEAKKYQAGLVLWTDGSKLNSGKSGAAVVWRNRRLNSWHEKKQYLGKKKQPFDTKLWTLFDALEIAIKETRNVNTIPVIVFTYSRAALTKIQKKA